MLSLTLTFSPFQWSELGPHTQKGNLLLLQNIMKYCSFRHIKLKLPCLSMLHVKTVCLLRPRLLQEEREVTPGFAHSAACPSPLLGSLQALPMTAHSLAQPIAPAGMETPASSLP